MKNLKGGVAVVTGGASGLGRAIAEEAARRGMKLVIADVEAGAMEQAVADLRAGGAEAIGVLTDVTSAASVEALAVATEQHFGPANLLFNNAGVASGGPIWESTEKDWKWLFGVNVDGVANGVQQVGLAQTGAAIEEQRVISATRIVGHLTGRRTGQLVGLTFDEILEGIVHVGVALVVRLRLGVSLAFPALLQVIHRRSTTRRRSCDRDGMGTITDVKTQGGSIGSAQLVDDAIDPEQVLVAYPVQNEAIRCIQGQSIVTQLRLKRPDPHAEFCRGQLILQPVKALLP